MTMYQILDIADDADLRATLIECSGGRIPSKANVARNVHSLHEVAAQLRMVAVRLRDDRNEPGDSRDDTDRRARNSETPDARGSA